MRVLVVEDASRLAEAVAEILRKQGYAVDIAEDGEDGEELARSGAYDVVLLDIMLPQKSGLEVVRDLRASGESVPVILLTARQGVDDRVAGLDAGADDYLPKPFHASELFARIRAVTRRPPVYCADSALVAAGLRLDTEALAVACADAPQACVVSLTPREAQLLEVLMRRSGRTVSKGDLIVRLWGPRSRASENRVEVLVHALREKLAGLPADARVQTVRGVGYRLLGSMQEEA